jgi:hypothetical protein
MRLAGTVTVSAAGVVAIAIAFTLGQCDGRRYEKAIAEDRATDLDVAHTDSASVADSLAWQHERDSLARAGQLAARRAVAAKHRADSLERVVAAAGELVPKADAQAALEAKGTTIGVLLEVIDQDSVGIRARDTRIGQLLGTVASYRDSIVPALTRERNRWRKRALAMCGLQGTAGLGLHGGDAVVGYGCRIPIRLPLIGGF